jgi:hypothetical protein
MRVIKTVPFGLAAGRSRSGRPGEGAPAHLRQNPPSRAALYLAAPR